MNIPAVITDKQKELLHCLGDVWWRLDNLYFIEDEKGNKVRFRLRPIQHFFLMSMWFFNIILKARQLGFTTTIDIFILDRALFNPNTKCGIVAHTKDDVYKIFSSKIKFGYDNLPPDIKGFVQAKSDRANEIEFTNGSSIRVAVSMRSGTLQCLHISEYGKVCAKFPSKAQEIRTGTLPTVHEDGFIWIESTAEGVGGHFHELSMESKEALDEGRQLSKFDYKFHFFPWWKDPKYEIDPPDGYEFSHEHLKYFVATEKAIAQKLITRKRYWYVVKEREQKELMKQEFPSYPEEAFLFSGRKAFDANALAEAKGECYDPIWIGDISVVDGRRNEAVDGCLVIWQLPDPNEQYAVGADVAEGLEHGDYSSADVLDSWGQQVASWHGHIDTDLFGQVLYWLGMFYNTAYLGVERNNHGHAVLNVLKAGPFRYKNLYVEEKVEEKNRKKTKKLGWLTNQVTKPLIIDNMKNLIREGESGIASKNHISECYTYVVDEKGRYGATPNCHDDRVMSYAIAHQMLALMPRKPKQDYKVERTARDWRAA